MDTCQPVQFPELPTTAWHRFILFLGLAWLLASGLIHGLVFWTLVSPPSASSVAISNAKSGNIPEGALPPRVGLIAEVSYPQEVTLRAEGLASMEPKENQEKEGGFIAAGSVPLLQPPRPEAPVPGVPRWSAATYQPTPTPQLPTLAWRTELEPIGAGGLPTPPGLPTPAALPPTFLPGQALQNANPFRSRRGEAKAALLKANGGTPASEEAVSAALQWLAGHQGADGLWSRQFFDVLHPREPSGGEPNDRLNAQGNLGVSGLAILAFTGAGHSPASVGPYQTLLQKARASLLSAQIRKQPSDGGFHSASDALWLYDDALATFALAELVLAAQFDSTPDEEGAAALQKAVVFLASAQQDGGGWDYTPQRTGRNDTSLTGFVTQAFRAAKLTGAKIPVKALLGIAAHLERATLEDGQVWYADRGIGVENDKRTGWPKLRYGPAMLAVGMTTRLWLGYRPHDGLLERQIVLLFGQYSPEVQKLTGGWDSQFHDYYYWYYGSLACLTLGGEVWQAWHPAVRDGLILLQRKNGPGRGSWNPFGAGWGQWGRTGGRVYATAINALTLETFYRYPSGLEGGAGWLLDVEAVDELLLHTIAKDRKMIVRLAGRLRLDISTPVLLKCLSDPDADVQLEAALALAQDGNKAAEMVLRKQLLTRSPELQGQISAALEKLNETK